MLLLKFFSAGETYLTGAGEEQVAEKSEPVVPSTPKSILRNPTPRATTPKYVSPQPTKADRRFSVQGFKSLMPAAAISAAALSLPMLVGRKRRSHDQHSVENNNNDGDLWSFPQSEDDPFVKHFTMENEREMRKKNIASSHCRQLTVEEIALSAPYQHLLICPGHESRTLNMILLDGVSR